MTQAQKYDRHVQNIMGGILVTQVGKYFSKFCKNLSIALAQLVCIFKHTSVVYSTLCLINRHNLRIPDSTNFLDYN